MAYALNSTYESVSIDPVGDFLRDAPALLDLETLTKSFASAIAMHGHMAHCCCAIDEDGSAIPLFGDMPALVSDVGRDGTQIINLETAEGEALVMVMAAAAPADRESLSTLRMLTTLYATYGMALYDADDETPADGHITAAEQQCFGMTMAGWSHLDIAERLDRSAPAIGVLLRRATARLGASSIAEAATIAMARGMISQLPVGRHC